MIAALKSGRNVVGVELGETNILHVHGRWLKVKFMPSEEQDEGTGGNDGSGDDDIDSVSLGGDM